MHTKQICKAADNGMGCWWLWPNKKEVNSYRNTFRRGEWGFSCWGFFWGGYIWWVSCFFSSVFLKRIHNAAESLSKFRVWKLKCSHLICGILTSYSLVALQNTSSSVTRWGLNEILSSLLRRRSDSNEDYTWSLALLCYFFFPFVLFSLLSLVNLTSSFPWVCPMGLSLGTHNGSLHWQLWNKNCQTTLQSWI